MAPLDRADDQVATRLAGLRLTPAAGGWVPEQPHAEVATAVPSHQPLPARPQPPRPPSGWRGPDWMRPAWLSSVTAGPSRSALLGLAGVCAVCVTVTAVTVLHRGAGAPVGPPPAAAAPLPAPARTPAGVVVDVGGRVRRPGLVTLAAGARVADALRAAGGAIRRSDLALVDLAARVTDGELLLIGVVASTSAAAGGAAGTAGSGGAPAGPVNLNTATVDQLDALPGIGPVLAQRILDWRSANGGFRSVDDLNQVSGIGDSIFAELAPLVSV